MPPELAIHWNTDDHEYPRYVGKVRCGRRLAKVKWRTDPKDATCDTCQRLARRDGKL
jgi:hypothetical protein